ncbi:MAG: hypothetical protein WBW33_30110 [Bryobacteraceae bacterium]
MGKLHVMPSPPPHVTEPSPKAAKQEQNMTPDLSIWKSAPRERTPDYFPVYGRVSRAMQGAMRRWVRTWFHANPELLQRPHCAYPFLVFMCTTPFYGKPTNVFTYDVQRTDGLVKAYKSASAKLKAELAALNTRRFDWFTREHYFAYRSKHVVEYVSKNQRSIYRMFNTETELMDSILKFTQIDIPSMKFEDALAELRRSFRVDLRRFSNEVDLSEHADELLRIATEVLLTSEAEADSLPRAA